jgi:hypothetical protein
VTLRLILQGVGFFTGLVRGDACLDACHCLPGVVRGERIQALGKALRCIGPREAVGEEGVQTSGSVDCLIGLAHDAPRTLAHIWNTGANAISLIEYRAIVYIYIYESGHYAIFPEKESATEVEGGCRMHADSRSADRGLILRVDD